MCRKIAYKEVYSSSDSEMSELNDIESNNNSSVGIAEWSDSDDSSDSIDEKSSEGTDLDMDKKELDVTANDNIVSLNDCIVLTFGQNILQLFKICHICGKRVSAVTHSKRGSMVIIKTVCVAEHIFIWRSQPIENKFSVGTIKLCAAIYSTGLSFENFTMFAKAMGLLTVSATTFYSVVRRFVGPVIRQVFSEQRSAIFASIKSEENVETRISGDGQYDSPGFCAKYATYSIMDLNTTKVIDFMVIQKGMVTGDLEKAACDKILHKLIHEDLKISVFLSDRHRGIRHLLRTKYSELNHQFDVWHMAKNLAKKIKTVEKKAPLLAAWKSSIVNHLWWAAQTCGGDPDLLIEKFLSVLHHICNIHSWEGNRFTACQHEPIAEEDAIDVAWLSPKSNDFTMLKSIVDNKQFLCDLRHVNLYCHTGALESYHNERLKYLPKRSHFSYDGMVLRGMLAILDHNFNVSKDVVSDSQKYSKISGKWVYRKIYRKKNYDWRQDLVKNVCSLGDYVVDVDQQAEYAGMVPENIAPVSKPSLDTTRQQYYSRFGSTPV
ncbi:uncharacterized protein LOC135127297 [Zophobas morio]|uniref:uncharacterized protein LOC135127297 n=1 Tax=Zophobas morio TaxID=2755281 RepID=UPI0030829597